MEPSTEVADLLRLHETRLPSIFFILCLWNCKLMRTLCGEGRHLPTNCSSWGWWWCIMHLGSCASSCDLSRHLGHSSQTTEYVMRGPWKGRRLTNRNPKCGSDLVTNWKGLRHLGYGETPSNLSVEIIHYWLSHVVTHWCVACFLKPHLFLFPEG